RAPIRFQEVTPPMVAEALGNFSTPAQNVPIDTTGGQQPWDDTGDIDADYLNRDPKEQTQPMFQLAALVAAGAMPATMAPGAAPAAVPVQAAPVAVMPTPVPPPAAAG